MSVILQHLSKMYGAQKAVDDISFSIGKGEIVGFLGPNGAGKSTTMKMITGYLEADSGTVEVSGIKVTTGSLDAKAKTGYLPESNPLYFDMYVREYLQFIGNIHKIKNIGAVMAGIIQTTGLSAEANKKIGQLSKGYKQRVGLAAALIHDPEVLILDEPTSGLDPNQIVEIRDVIKRLGQNKTVLFSSHILQEVQALCDRVIIINKGKIVADDNLDNLQKGGKDKATTVMVSFRERLDRDALQRLDKAMEVEELQTEADRGSSFRIRTDDPDSIRKQLMELSLKSSLNIVSLQSERNSLEEIFKYLTRPV